MLDGQPPRARCRLLRQLIGQFLGRIHAMGGTQPCQVDMLVEQTEAMQAAPLVV